MGEQIYAWKQGVRPHIDRDGNPDGQQKEQHLYDRRTHQEKDEQDQRHADAQHQDQVVGHAGIVFHFHDGPRSETRLYAICKGFPVRIGREHVLVERMGIVLPDFCKAGAVEQARQHRFKGIGRRLCEKHHAKRLHPDVHRREILLQDGDSAPHGRILRQGGGHVAVDPGLRNKQGRDKGGGSHQREEIPTPPDQQAGRQMLFIVGFLHKIQNYKKQPLFLPPAVELWELIVSLLK